MRTEAAAAGNAATASGAAASGGTNPEADEALAPVPSSPTLSKCSNGPASNPEPDEALCCPETVCRYADSKTFGVRKRLLRCG